MAVKKKGAKAKRTPARKPAAIYELKITLLGANPPIWRRFTVPSDIRLDRLHEVIQVVMGWDDSHLHQFVIYKPDRPKARGVDCTYFRPRPPDDFGVDPGFIEESNDTAEYEVRNVLKKSKDRIVYEYDFGDGWEHGIELVQIQLAEKAPKHPLCLAGRRACPPDDCGGIWGYVELREALKDPGHERHEELVEWVGGDFDPDEFDLDEINGVLRELG